MSNPLAFFHLIESLKTTPRTGWLNEGLTNPESIADHMYRMAVTILLCNDQSLDKSKMLKIAIIHDMAEAICGDITPLDRVPKAEKQRIELDAMKKICNDLLPQSTYRFASEEIMELFLEYEHRASAEAKYVKDVDKFELALQTFEYEKAHKVPGDRKLDHFYESGNLAEHPQVKEWCEALTEERNEWWDQQNGITTAGEHTS